MQAEITPLFPVPVYQSSTDYLNFVNEINFLSSLDLIKARNNSVSKNVQVLDYHELSKCKEICEKHLQIFIENTLDCKQEFYITNSWIARSRPGESHHVHFHPNSIISGVLYLQAEQDAGNIVLHHKSSLRHNFDFTYDVNSYNIFNSATWKFSVSTGQIIIFPSWVNHSVEENRSNSDRIILGFNTFVKGTFGDAEYSANLTL
jgi:uncharacterized protein (TIGR02466 family)